LLLTCSCTGRVVTEQRTPTDRSEALAIAADVPAETEAATGLAATDLAAQLDALRIAVGKVDALAAVVVESYDHADWSGADPIQVERMAYLLGAVAEAATAAIAVVDRFHGFVADRQRAEAGDEW
jgi:hypothetical protein